VSSRPPQRTQLIRREIELAKVRERLDAGAPLVTLTGPPGVGKTTLALHAMAHAEPELGEGWRVVRCDVADVRDEDGLLAALARALGTPVSLADEGARARLLEALSSAPTWLLLDNFDHLVAIASELVGEWAAEVAELVVLVTSRERLGLAIEHVLEIAPLTVDDGVALFQARALAAGASGSWTDAELATIADVVRELDGLPLAIELAAARCNLLTPAELLARLHDRFELLKKTRPASDLRRTIETSWALLGDEEKRALARCSTFRGGFSAKDAEVVCGVDVDTIQSLRDKSLITLDRLAPAATTSSAPPRPPSSPSDLLPSTALPPPPPRSARLTLLQSIRSFAEDHLGPDADPAREAHARWAGELARRAIDEVDGPGIAAAIAKLHTNYDNLCAACDWSLPRSEPHREIGLRILHALCKLDRLSDFRVALVDRLESAIPPPDREVGLQEIDLLIQLGLRLDQQGQGERAEAALERAREAASRQAAPRHEGRALRLLSETLCARGQFQRARDLADAALAVAERTNDEWLRAYALDGVGYVDIYAGDPARARAVCERALEIFRRLGNPFEEVPVLTSLTFIHASLGDVDRAIATAAEGLRLHDEIGVARSSLRVALATAVARAEHFAGHLESACRGYEENARLAVVLGYRRLEAYARGYLGIARFEQGAESEGRAILKEAIALVLATGDIHYGAFLRGTLGAMETRTGDPTEGARLLTEAEATLEGQDTSPLRAALAIYRGQTSPDGIGSSSGSVGLFEVALAHRIVTGKAGVPAVEPPRGGRLVVAADGSWFEPPAGDRVHIGKRPVMRRMVLALAQAHRDRPEHSVSQGELLQAGWPDERVLPQAARRRLQVMVGRMRDLGLRGLLETTDIGYRLTPQVEVDLVA
jgi:tetratricopeptide (TPR) repeat protein